MDLITREQRDTLIWTFERDAYHLELKDEDNVATGGLGHRHPAQHVSADLNYRY